MARTRRLPLAATSDHVDDDSTTVLVVPPPSDLPAAPVSVVDHIVDDSTTVPMVPHVQEPALSHVDAPMERAAPNLQRNTSSPSQHVRTDSVIPPPAVTSRSVPPVTNGNTPPTHSVIQNINSSSLQPSHDRPANKDNSYFVGSGDHPGLILVTPPLSDHNFQQWRWDFLLALGAKNKTGFIDGTLPQPDPTSHLFHS
ncbi:hypothetical protein CsatA_001771 [Cannabis sativa]